MTPVLKRCMRLSAFYYFLVSVSYFSHLAGAAGASANTPVSFSDLTSAARRDAVKLANQDFDSLAEEFDLVFAPGLIERIVSKDPVTSLFLLPSDPNTSLLTKLVYTLNTDAKRLNVMAYMVRQYSHYDPVSEKIFKNVIESLKTVSDLHKSIDITDGNGYDKVIEASRDLISSLLTFLRNFTSTLLVSRLSEVDSFKKFILNYSILEGLFHVAAIFNEDFGLTGFLIDLIFGAVDNVQDERAVWSFYLRHASASTCLPLPHEFLSLGHSHGIRNSLVSDLMKLLKFDKTTQLNPAWLVQFGTLLRFRTITFAEMISLVENISAYFDQELFVDGETLAYFMRLVFLDEFDTKNYARNAVNFLNSSPIIPENPEEFYISIWNSTVAKFTVASDNTEFYNFFLFVIQKLEAKFPGITEHLKTDVIDPDGLGIEVGNLEFVQNVALFRPSNFEETVDFVTIIIAHEIQELPIKAARYRLTFILNKLIEIIRIIDGFDENSQRLLRDAVADQLNTLKGFAKLLPFLTETDEIEMFLDFAFKLTDISKAERVFGFVYARTKTDAHLLSHLFSSFAEKLKLRPDFFFLNFDRHEFIRLDKNLISNFIEKIQNVPISTSVIPFYTSAYLNFYIGKDQIYQFFDNLKQNLSLLDPDDNNLLSFFASITDLSFLEFEEDCPFDQKLEEVREIAVKSFLLMTEMEQIDVTWFNDFESGLLPWLCVRLSTFEALKPALTTANQLDFSIDNLDTLDLGELASLCTKILSKFFQNGASQTDLQSAYEVVKKTREVLFICKETHQRKTNLAVAASFCLLVLIIRSDDSLVSSDYAINAIESYKMRPYRLCVAQLIYKSFQDPEKRSNILPVLFKHVFDRLQFGFLHDESIFNGIPREKLNKHLKKHLNEIFSPNGIDRIRLEAFAFWMSKGLVPVEFVKQCIEKIGTIPGYPPDSKLAAALIRAVFKRAEYQTVRELAARILFASVDHTVHSPRPLSLGIIGGVADLVGEPEFLATFDIRHAGAFDIKAIIDHEYQRKSRVTAITLDLAEGIENVLESYSEAFASLAAFEMSLARKTVLLNSIHSNLSRLDSESGDSDLIAEGFTATLIDHFVRVAINLAVQIHLDSTGPIYLNDLEANGIELYISCLVKFVRDSNVQARLVFHICSAIKDRIEAREAILNILPRFINWKRFFLLPDSFRFIFNFNMRIDDFLFDIINSAFKFEECLPDEADDFTRNLNDISMIHEAFFNTMAVLINNFYLPAKFTSAILDKMNENYDSVDILSMAVVRFLRAAIKIRKIEPQSPTYLKTCQSYGANVIYDSQREIVGKVVEFLSKRPDFVSMAMVNEKGSEPFQLILELELMAKSIPAFKEAPMQLIKTIFNWPNAELDSLLLLKKVFLPRHTVRSMISWISNDHETSHPLVIKIAGLVLDLIPQSFTIDSFCEGNISQSWLPVSVNIIQWFTELCAIYPQQFGRSITVEHVDSYLNILLWNLELDGKEEIVSHALINFIETLVSADDHVKYHFVHNLAHSYYRPILLIFRQIKTVYLKFCGVLRLLKTTGDFSIQYEIQKLLTIQPASGMISIPEDEIITERQLVIELSTKLMKFDELKSSEIKTIFGDICTALSRLRIVGEFDLIIKLIKDVTDLANIVYPQTPSEKTFELAICVAVAVNFLRLEILLIANDLIFGDLFKFVYKHAQCFNEIISEAFELLLSQIVSVKEMKRIFASIVKDLQLSHCKLPSDGFPAQFYINNTSEIERFFSDYLTTMTRMALGQGIFYVNVDSFHFVFLFNILHKSNARDAFFLEWINKMSGMRENSTITEHFAENLKAHCIARPHLIDGLAGIYINPVFIEKVFNLPRNENILSVFRLIYKHNPQIYQNCVNRLPRELEALMRENVGGAVDEKKRALVQGFLAQCNLPENNFNGIVDYKTLLSKLDTVFKLDLSVLPVTEFRTFMEKLDNLHRSTKPNSNAIALSVAIQIKNHIKPESEAIRSVLKTISTLQVKPEICELILKDICELEISLNPAALNQIALTIPKLSDPFGILNRFLSRPAIDQLSLINSILASNANHLDLSQIFSDLIANVALNRRNELPKWLETARKFNLLSKTKMLILENLQQF